MAGLKQKSLVNNMTEGPLFRQLITFSTPIILGNILQSCYTIVDMVVVGNFIGANGLSAVGIGGILSNLILSVAMGAGTGGQILISQQVGANLMGAIKKTFGTFMTVMFLCAILLAIAGISAADWLLHVMNTPETAYAPTRNYFLICCSGIIFVYGYNCITSIFRGLGESRLPMLLILVSTLCNITLDFLLVGSLHMGVAGAALATIISQGVVFSLSFIILFRRRTEVGFDFRLSSFRPDRKTSLVILKLSLPIIAFGFLLSVSSMFVNSNVNEFGVAASAVDSIGNKINIIVSAIGMGLYTGAGAVIAQCFGAGNISRIRKTFWLTELVSMIVWLVIGFVMIFLSREVFGLFTQDEDVLAMAAPYMRISVLMFLGVSLSSGAFALFEGVGNTALEMGAGILDSIIAKITLSILFSQSMGLFGYWFGCAVASFATPLVGFIYYFCGLWTKRKPSLPDR